MNGNLSDCSAHALSLHIHTTWMLWACEYIRLSQYGQRIEINQKSNSRENLSPLFQCACPKIRHQYAILTPSLQVPLALLIFKRHLPVTKADVLLTSCTYIRKSWRSKLPVELARMEYWSRRMATMRCARWHARGHQLQRYRYRVALPVNLYSVVWVYFVIYEAQKRLSADQFVIKQILPSCKSITLI